MTPDSPLLAAGAKAGDTLVFDHFRDRRRILAKDEVIGATLFADGRARQVQLRPIDDPDHQRAVSVFLESIAICTGLVCALLIGLRRSDSRAMRVLSLVLLCYGLGT